MDVERAHQAIPQPTIKLPRRRDLGHGYAWMRGNPDPFDHHRDRAASEPRNEREGKRGIHRSFSGISTPESCPSLKLVSVTLGLAAANPWAFL